LQMAHRLQLLLIPVKFITLTIYLSETELIAMPLYYFRDRMVEISQGLPERLRVGIFISGCNPMRVEVVRTVVSVWAMLHGIIPLAVKQKLYLHVKMQLN